MKPMTRSANARSSQYDSNKRYIGVFDALGNQIDRRDYDLLNNKGIVRDGNGNATTLIYDARGNVLEEIDPLGQTKLCDATKILATPIWKPRLLIVVAW